VEKLDRFEEQIEKELERDEWNRSKYYDGLEKTLKKGARAVLKKKPISIRLSERDIMLLRKKSLETEIAYQTLIAMLVRQYVEGKIKKSYECELYPAQKILSFLPQTPVLNKPFLCKIPLTLKGSHTAEG